MRNLLKYTFRILILLVVGFNIIYYGISHISTGYKDRIDMNCEEYLKKYPLTRVSNMPARCIIK